MKSAILDSLFVPLSIFKMQFKMDQPVATVCHNGPFENLFRVVILIGCRPVYLYFLPVNMDVTMDKKRIYFLLRITPSYLVWNHFMASSLTSLWGNPMVPVHRFFFRTFMPGRPSTT